MDFIKSRYKFKDFKFYVLTFNIRKIVKNCSHIYIYSIYIYTRY